MKIKRLIADSAFDRCRFFVCAHDDIFLHKTQFDGNFLEEKIVSYYSNDTCLLPNVYESI